MIFIHMFQSHLMRNRFKVEMDVSSILLLVTFDSIWIGLIDINVRFNFEHVKNQQSEFNKMPKTIKNNISDCICGIYTWPLLFSNYAHTITLFKWVSNIGFGQKICCFCGIVEVNWNKNRPHIHIYVLFIVYSYI